tara:strand:- start:1038 stop:1562 length:525 start_codon:yes stop_codon:yes gene_type:complete
MSIDKNFLKIKNHLLNEQIELDDNDYEEYKLLKRHLSNSDIINELKKISKSKKDRYFDFDESKKIKIDDINYLKIKNNLINEKLYLNDLTDYPEYLSLKDNNTLSELEDIFKSICLNRIENNHELNNDLNFRKKIRSIDIEVLKEDPEIEMKLEKKKKKINTRENVLDDFLEFF